MNAVAALARELAPKVGADPALAERAARLAKADLVSEMVGEFPELQGVMAATMRWKRGEPAAVADAIRDHYKPQGPSDNVPTDPVGIAVALADKPTRWSASGPSTKTDRLERPVRVAPCGARRGADCSGKSSPARRS